MTVSALVGLVLLAVVWFVLRLRRNPGYRLNVAAQVAVREGALSKVEGALVAHLGYALEVQRREVGDLDVSHEALRKAAQTWWTSLRASGLTPAQAVAFEKAIAEYDGVPDGAVVDSLLQEALRPEHQ